MKYTPLGIHLIENVHKYVLSHFQLKELYLSNQINNLYNLK
jgi:hypothetical protein